MQVRHQDAVSTKSLNQVVDGLYTARKQPVWSIKSAEKQCFRHALRNIHEVFRAKMPQNPRKYLFVRGEFALASARRSRGGRQCLPKPRVHHGYCVFTFKSTTKSPHRAGF
jgi:hypothetical protein